MINRLSSGSATRSLAATPGKRLHWSATRQTISRPSASVCLLPPDLFWGAERTSSSSFPRKTMTTWLTFWLTKSRVPLYAGLQTANPHA